MQTPDRPRADRPPHLASVGASDGRVRRARVDPVEHPAGDLEEVCRGHDTHQAAIRVDDGQCMKLVGEHAIECGGDRNIWRDRLDLSLHDLRDRDRATRVGGEGTQDVAVRHDADDLVLGVDDDDMVNAIEVEQPVREEYGVPFADRSGTRRHDLADWNRGHDRAPFTQRAVAVDTSSEVVRTGENAKSMRMRASATQRWRLGPASCATEVVRPVLRRMKTLNVCFCLASFLSVLGGCSKGSDDPAEKMIVMLEDVAAAIEKAGGDCGKMAKGLEAVARKHDLAALRAQKRKATEEDARRAEEKYGERMKMLLPKLAGLLACTNDSRIATSSRACCERSCAEHELTL